MTVILPAPALRTCLHCGMLHGPTCWRIKAIEYYEDGVTVKRIEYHDQLRASRSDSKEGA